MGFQKKWDCQLIKSQLHAMSYEASSPYNDGWTASSCKHELYQLKCIIEDLYSTLPHFVGEEIWEQERLIQQLKK
jgi:hypothetical protein